MVFSINEISSLKESIEYYRFRQGHSSKDPLLKIVDKHNQEKLGLNGFNKTDLLLILKVIDEVNEFIESYEDYKDLTKEQEIDHKNRILEPLSSIKNKIEQIY